MMILEDHVKLTEELNKILDEIIEDGRRKGLINDEKIITPLVKFGKIDPILQKDIDEINTNHVVPSKLIKIIDRLIASNLEGVVEIETLLNLRVKAAVNSLVYELNHLEVLFETSPQKAILTLSGMYILPKSVFDTINPMRFSKMLEIELTTNWDTILKEVVKVNESQAYKTKKVMWNGSYPELVELFVLLKKQNLIIETGQDDDMSWMEITENFVKCVKNNETKNITSNNLSSKFADITSKLSGDTFRAKFSVKGKTLKDFKEKLIKQHKSDSASSTV